METVCCRDAACTQRQGAAMKRHMLFHVCPLISGGEVWRKHVSHIRSHAHLFNGKIVIGIVRGEGLESPETVQDAMKGISVTDWVIEGNTHVHESTTFVKMLERIQWEPGITFRGHCKGVSHPSGKVEHEWADVMWRICMDIKSVDKAMETHVFAGAFKIQEGASREPDAYRWFFAGTFFWFQNAAVFARNWRAGHREWDRWYAEWWPGDLATNKEAHCLFMDNMRRRDFRRGRWNDIVMPEFLKQVSK